MAANFTDADEARFIAARLIPSYHGHLANATIAYLFTDKPRNRGGKRVLGSMQKTSPMQRYLTRHRSEGDDAGVDFVMLLDYEVWQTLTDEQRVALVDHELSHGTVEYDEGDNPTWGTRGHDVEEFADVIRRHGLWQDDLVIMANAIEQLRLPLEAAA